MKIKYIGSGSFHAKGIRFETGGEYEVTDDIGNYLVQTFSVNFEVVPVEEKPAPKRAKKVKRAVPEEE